MARCNQQTVGVEIKTKLFEPGNFLKQLFLVSDTAKRYFLWPRDIYTECKQSTHRPFVLVGRSLVGCRTSDVNSSFVLFGMSFRNLLFYIELYYRFNKVLLLA